MDIRTDREIVLDVYTGVGGFNEIGGKKCMKLSERILVLCLLGMMLMVLMLDSDFFLPAIILCGAFALIGFGAHFISEWNEPFIKVDSNEDRVAWNREEVFRNWLESGRIK